MRNMMFCSMLSKMPAVHNGYIKPALHKKAGVEHMFLFLLQHEYNRSHNGIQTDKSQLQIHHYFPLH